MVVMWYHGSRLWYAVASGASMLPCQKSKRTVGYLVYSLQQNGSANTVGFYCQTIHKKFLRRFGTIFGLER